MDEELIVMRDVPAMVAELRPGSTVRHWSTPLRWATRGCRGVVLWSTFVGWQRMTHRRAVREFLERLDALRGSAADAPETARQTTRRQRQLDARLSACGW